MTSMFRNKIWVEKCHPIRSESPCETIHAWRMLRAFRQAHNIA